MKKIYYSAFIIGTMVLANSCAKSFLETKPQATISTDELATPKGVESLLTGAYGLMNGNINGTWGNYSSASSQWLFGEVAGDNAHKGSTSGDQSTMNAIELHSPNSANDQLPAMWNNYFEGVLRCNNTLALLKTVQSGTDASNKLEDDRAKQVEAEARTLRAHYYFFLRRVFKNVPYVDETISTADAVKVSNNVEIYPKIEADLQFAIDNLDYTKPLGEVGRIDKLIAEAYLGKVYLYEQKYAEALTLFKDVIAHKPSLSTMDFRNNFSIAGENGPEAIFVDENVINPDGSGDNANVGDMLSGLYGTAPVSCCGFFLPSIDLVNAFKVDANGLPYLDGSYRNNPYKSDLGLAGAAKTNYAVDQTIAFDPRVDYTVGRRGVPYKDWGIFPGDAWIRDPASGGPFVSKKQMIDKAEWSGNTVSGGEYITALDVNIIRLADVYLMAAECAIETEDLPYALGRVNDVRNRAANLPGLMVNGTPAAEYNVKPYPSFPDADYARSAVRFERRLELALEGQRFFDLVRWGIAKPVLESYMNFEKQYVSASSTITFNPDKDNIFPIPQQELDRAPGALTQNPGY
ncbi:MAG: RagB/SusD family nutrient uptake outer membrane protein [Sphingobacteriales bacterium]|nr:RagB/SusD family nutrient uptake outer membrane protein [Sphingobacteriales bacterium]OJY87386.1 MAG: RagB/SusD family nutrient uptake outer membrane protein [Sphingobacteriales bacterium 44-15]